MEHTSLAIVPQDSTDPREIFATETARASALPPKLSAVLTEIEDVARSEGIPIIGRLEGAIVRMLAGLHYPAGARVLDIGTAIGYSALWLADALPADGRIVSIEIDPIRAARAEGYIARAGYADRIEVMVGDAFDLIPELGTFDLIFQDVMKHAYFGSDPYLALELLKQCTSHLADDGVMIIDNAFCGGCVFEPDSPDTVNQVIGVRNLNEALAKDPSFQSVIVPLRDGLWVARRVDGEAVDRD
jgi:caffeoyl-CoA O-methyltransferase